MDADAVLHPRGPLPPGVYWRRRGLTLLAFVVLVLLASRACGSDGTPTASVSQTPAPSVTPSVTKTAAPPKKTATPSPSATATGPCTPADLVLNARADADTYPGGRRPVLTIGIKNGGAAPCTYDVGQANREILVTSGNDRVWSSDDCSPGGAAQVVTLQPGAKPTEFSVTWSRQRSRPDCPAARREAAAGTYRVVGRFGDQTSAHDSFTLG